MKTYEIFRKQFLNEIANFRFDNDYLDEKEFKDLIFTASLYHEPMNWSGKEKRQELLKRINHHETFADVLNKAGVKSRFYFPFKEADLSTFTRTAYAFYTCKNFKKYSDLWRKNAPVEYSKRIIFLYMLATITYKGMSYESRIIKEKGYTPSSAYEDYNLGIDAWDDKGNPIQIKSPATQRGLDKEKK